MMDSMMIPDMIEKKKKNSKRMGSSFTIPNIKSGKLSKVVMINKV